MQLYASAPRFLLPALLSAMLALGRTDLEGCVSTEVIVQQYYASYIWYVPGTGEICSFLDCGGGRAPPKTTQPGCAGYKGTETVTPSYLPGFGAAESTATTAAPTIVISQSQAETSPSDTDVANRTESDGSTITEAPSMTISAATVITTRISTPSSASTSSHSSAPDTGSSSTPSSSTSSSSSSSSRASTAGASSQTGGSKNIMGVAAAIVGGLALL